MITSPKHRSYGDGSHWKRDEWRFVPGAVDFINRAMVTLTLYPIETYFNTFANIVDADQAAVRAA